MTLTNWKWMKNGNHSVYTAQPRTKAIARELISKPFFTHENVVFLCV